MGIDFLYILGGGLVGLGATLITDVWALLLRLTLNVAPPNFCFLGRWIRYMPAGTFVHINIADSPKISAECAIGWIAHYVIGIAFALMLITLTSGSWLDNPSPLLALSFGIGTVVFPFLIMQPSLGQGVAASNAPSPNEARLKSLVTHAVFGVGLYVSALPVSFLIHART